MAEVRGQELEVGLTDQGEGGVLLQQSCRVGLIGPICLPDTVSRVEHDASYTKQRVAVQSTRHWRERVLDPRRWRLEAGDPLHRREVLRRFSQARLAVDPGALFVARASSARKTNTRSSAPFLCQGRQDDENAQSKGCPPEMWGGRYEGEPSLSFRLMVQGANMRLLRLSDAEAGPRDHVFCYSRTRALLLGLAWMTAILALVFRAFDAHWKAGYYLAAVLFLFLLLTQRFITARFRTSNWLVRMNDEGAFIQFRSYLNYHLPPEDLTVVFLSFGEVRSARIVRERMKVYSSQEGTSTQTFRHVELELAGDTAPLEKALEIEATEKAPAEKRWYGSSSTLYQDHPLRMKSPPFLQIRWLAVPSAQKFLDMLRPYSRVDDPVSLNQDFVHLQSLTRDEQLKRLRELAARGETIAAIYTARRLYGCGLAEAKEMIEGTVSPQASAQAQNT